jgi:hypothetical protein
MDTETIIGEFRQSISARNLFYLLSSGHEDDPGFIKLLRCAMVYHGLKIVDLEKELGVNRTTLKRMLHSLEGRVRDATKMYVFARIIRNIEVQERVIGQAPLPRRARRLEMTRAHAGELAASGAA